MPIRYAFSTVACPDWSIGQVVARAKEWGYEGVELRTLGPGGGQLASDPAQSDAAKVRAAFDGSGVSPICLSTSAALHYRDAGKAKAAHFEIMRDLDLAAAIGCPQLRLFGLKVEPGENRPSVIHRIAVRAAPLVERAGELGVELLFENAGSFNAAKEWWWLLNLVDHPMAGMCWNVANAAAADLNERGGGMAVTMLNSRIRLVKVKDTKLGAGSGFCQLGDGDINIEPLLKKLRGIGYDGFVTVEWDKAWLPTLAPAEEILPEALTRMRDWMKAIEDWSDLGRKSAEKAAKRVVPKTRAQIKEEMAKA